MASTKLTWEIIQDDEIRISRTKVPHGWIVKMINKGMQIATCFIPDKNHSWLTGEKSNTQASAIDEWEALCLSIDELDISNRAKRVLRSEGFSLVGEIVCDERMLKKNSFEPISYFKNIGKQTYKEIIAALQKLGFYTPKINQEFLKMIGVI